MNGLEQILDSFPNALSQHSESVAVTVATIDAHNLHRITPANGDASVVDRNGAFLERAIAWPGPEGAGYANLHMSFPNQAFDPNQPETEQNKRQLMTGWPHKTQQSFVADVLYKMQGGFFRDAWFCTSQQSETRIDNKGKIKARKLKANATAFRAIWIDCDVKPGPKHYNSAGVALKAIIDFTKKVGLPYPSAVVWSGGGWHIYWISDRVLATNEWRVYAEALKSLLISEGVLCDTGLTADAARILRVPGTYNHKYNPPVLVEVKHLGRDYNFNSKLSALGVIAPTKSVSDVRSLSARAAIEPGPEAQFEGGPDPAFASLTGADDLAAGIFRRSSLLLDAGPVFDKCGFMREARDTGGADYDQTLWMYSVLIAIFLDGGEAIAHEISRGHPDYSPADTQAMYERKLTDHTERGIGWPSCATIQGAGCKSCATCSVFAQGKSPLHLTGPANATVTNLGSRSNTAGAMSGQPSLPPKTRSPLHGGVTALLMRWLS